MPWWAIAIEVYAGIGLVYSVYLFHAARIEGEVYEIVFHTLLWPLDLACWVESKFINR